MTIEKRIKLQNNIYFIVIDVEYKIKNNILGLYLKNEEKDYYDGGDLTILIEKVEKNYTSEKAKK